ncbi:MAG: GTPase, partial [Planctomycetota bacterium]
MPDPAPTNPTADAAANPLATVLPKVAIVGRPNVGKSSLLNALAGRRISIVDPTAGVTRDRVATNVAIPAHDEHAPPRYIELIDTGGYGIADSDNLTAEVEQQIARGIADADAVLFVTDAQA